MSRKLSVVILIIFPFVIRAQWMPEDLLTSYYIQEADTHKLLLDMDMMGFFKNNEYFSLVSKGQTFPGIRLLTNLRYQPTNRLKTELGFTSLYYSGDQYKDGVYVFNGVWTQLQYAFHPDLHLILGNYYGRVNHRLIEPLYSWEQQLTGKPESGIQLLYENKKYFLDMWLNWQRFIQHGDSVPEVLTFGISSSVNMMPVNNRFHVSIPLQLVIHHEGGQIDTSDKKMIVSGNIATGLIINHSFENKYIKKIGLDLYVAGYYDKLADRKMRPYDFGWGIYPVVQLEGKDAKAMLGYWHAEKYYSFDGEKLFGSFNTLYPGNKLPVRNLLTAKASYSKEIVKCLSVGGQLEAYMDIGSRKTDYSFGICIRFSSNFRLK